MVNRLFGTSWINCESHMCSSVAVGHDSDLVLTSFWTSFFPQLTSHKLCGKWLFSFNCTVWLDCSCCRCGSCCWFLLASDGFCLLLLASACSCCFLPTAAVFCWIFFGCDFSGPVVGGVPCRKGDGSKVGGTSGSAVAVAIMPIGFSHAQYALNEILIEQYH